MHPHATGIAVPAGTGTGRPARRRRTGGLDRLGAALIAAAVGLITAVVAMQPASAQENAFQRGPAWENTNVTRLAIPWLKTFIDNDTRTGYENTGPYEPGK